MIGHHFTANGKVYLVRCYDCGRENYALAVPSGRCAFCGGEPPKSDPVQGAERIGAVRPGAKRSDAS